MNINDHMIDLCVFTALLFTPIPTKSSKHLHSKHKSINLEDVPS
jgi:hypothetical protein